MSANIGDRIGDYEIVGMLGAGGMGRVYKVRNVITDRAEALKVLLPDLANVSELADRFMREIKVLARPRTSQHRRASHRAAHRQPACHGDGTGRGGDVGGSP